MRTRSIITTVSLAAAAAVVGPLATPAGAGVGASSSGTTVTVALTGNEAITFECTSGNLRIAATSGAYSPLPSIGCATVTLVTVNGDSGDQHVNGTTLNASAFTANPQLVASLGDGNDGVSETHRSDQINLGAGIDWLELHAGGLANGTVDMGGGTDDSLVVYGTPDANAITAASGGASVNVLVTYPGGSSTSTAANAERITIYGREGDDTINTGGIIAGSTITYASNDGGPGDDTVTDGALDSALFGGSGTNTLTGGGGVDAYWSESTTDTINGGSDANGEWIYDSNGLRSGGRTLTGFTAADTYVVQAHQGDVTQRVRPGSGGVVVTTSLTRTGQQLVPSPLGKVALGQAYVGSLAHRGIADIVASDVAATATLPNVGTGLLDVTVPTGTPLVEVSAGNVVVASSFATISATNVDDYRVHGPWTNKNQGFAHRVYRDLLFRFPTNAVRDQVRDQLASGTKTRAAVAQGLIDTDEYRGLDADRVYLKYLRRASDPGGRAYWIGALSSGRPLWRFRAQLVGSNEYFTKAGGTNDSFVTQVYRDVLGREPDPSGQAHWVAKLDGGAERGMVALQFINAAEVRHRVVDDQFLRFLDRLPTSSEQASWSASLTTANGEQAMIAALVSSAGYYNRS